MAHTTTATPSLTRYAWLSIAAAVLTIVLKTSALLLTGSVGLLSDALESLVNLAGALMALSMLTISRARPTKSMPTATARLSTFPAAWRAR
ncbi:MAG: cation transporter [Caldilineaceae bacterium]